MGGGRGIFASDTGNIGFTVGIPLVAILSGLYVWFNPGSLGLVLTLDLWLLGYHHVIATFTRLVPNIDEAKLNYKYLIHLPVLVVSAISILYFTFGVVSITSLYIYWQWYHYTRQSEGISKSFGFKSNRKQFVSGSFSRFTFYFVSIICFVWMITRNDMEFLGQAYWAFSLDENLRLILLVLALAIFLVWFVQSVWLVSKGELTLYCWVYMLSHYAIYAVAYVIIDDITNGWLVVNIWHNAQYLGFVWLFNNRRYGVVSNGRFPVMSYLSDTKRMPIYFLTFLIVSIVVYNLIEFLISQARIEYVGMLMVTVYAVINFHHYIVDSKIWKLRNKVVHKAIGVGV